MVSCVLCRSDISQGTSKTKLVRINHGEQGKELKERLEVFMFYEYQRSLNDCPSLLMEDALVCHKCKSMISRFFDSIAEMNTKRDLLKTRIGPALTADDAYTTAVTMTSTRSATPGKDPPCQVIAQHSPLVLCLIKLIDLDSILLNGLVS